MSHTEKENGMARFINIKQQAGHTAANKHFFGEHNRYAVAPVHTRFKDVAWLVWDANRPDEDGYASVIRQENTRSEAMAGLAR